MRAGLSALLFGAFVLVARAQDEDGAADSDTPGWSVPARSPRSSVVRSPVGPGRSPPPEVVAAWEASRNLPLPERIAANSAPLLGAAYLLDGLGEGEGTDPDPLVRFDRFDCLTFVEEVVALGLTGAPEHAAAVRLGLRYGEDRPRYAARHHFMELQWLPEAVRLGYLRDTTRSYGETLAMERVVDDEAWVRWPGRKNFPIPDAEMPSGVMRLQVLPLEHAIEIAQQIRPGSLVATVRADRASTPLWITHVGLVVAGERKMFRHASRMAARRVTDHDLAWFLRHQRTYTGWPVVGVVVLEPREFGPRLARLPADHPGRQPAADRAAPTPKGSAAGASDHP